LRALRSAIQPLDFSDHHAIWAEFDMAQAATIPANSSSSSKNQ